MKDSGPTAGWDYSLDMGLQNTGPGLHKCICFTICPYGGLDEISVLFCFQTDFLLHGGCEHERQQDSEI